MKKSLRIKYILALVLTFTLSLSALPAGVAAQTAPAVEAKPRTLDELNERIAALLDTPQFRSARWGIHLSTDDGRTLFSRDLEKSFMPASNMKLYTSAAALDAFGPDFRVETSVYASRPVTRAGLLAGNLILYGRGDPNLSARFAANGDISDYKAADVIPAIESLADQIAARGVKRIAGDIIGDDSYFAGDLLGPGWEWDDAQFYYGAEISALTVNDNVVTFTVKPARSAGEPPIIEVQPRTSYVTIVNHATTVARGPARIGVHRALNSNTVEFFGKIARTSEKYEVNIAVHDPARFAAHLLREALARRDIRVTGKTRRLDAVARLKSPFAPERLMRLAAVMSQPLSEMLKVVNKPSQNLHTELLLLQLGALRGTGPAIDDYDRPVSTLVRGNEVRKQFLERAGAEVQGLSLRDGSGLARQDLVTPQATTALLRYMLAHKHFNVFYDSLPVAGVDGTLKRRMTGTPAAGNVRAKTGSLSNVNALSGYLTTRRGHRIIFSFIGNNYTGPGRDVTAVFDQICALLCEFEGDLGVETAEPTE